MALAVARVDALEHRDPHPVVADVLPDHAERRGACGDVVAVHPRHLLALATGYGAESLFSLADLYPGFRVTVGGSLLGLVYGFMSGFIGFFLLAWLYNLLGPLQDDEEQSLTGE